MALPLSYHPITLKLSTRRFTCTCLNSVLFMLFAMILHTDPRLQLAIIAVKSLATIQWKSAFYSLHIHACAQECTCTGTRARVTTRSCCTLCPLSVCISVPLLMSQIRIVLSRLHVMRRRLLNASASTASR